MGLAELLGTIAAAGPLTGGVWFIPFYFIAWAVKGYRLNIWWTLSGLLAVIVISGTTIYVLPHNLPNLTYIVFIPAAANAAFFIHAYKVNRPLDSSEDETPPI
mgnify:FL=1